MSIRRRRGRRGPGGRWTALRLARRGARVAIVDPSHPREKPCGGGVTGRALALVGDALGERAAGGRDPQRSIRRVGGRQARPLSGSSRRRTRRSWSPAVRSSTGCCCPRRVRAGARLLAARVTGLTRDGGGWRIDTAPGPALERRDARRRGRREQPRAPARRAAFRRDQLSIATGFFAHGVTGRRDRDRVHRVIRPATSGRSRGPITWRSASARRPMQAVTAGALRARTARWIAATGIAPGARLEPYAWPIPSLSAHDLQTQALAGPGWMLVGDAAGLVDPITREGIFFALQSASSAAEALSLVLVDTRRGRARLSRARRVGDRAGTGPRRALQGGLLSPALHRPDARRARTRANASVASWPTSSPARSPIAASSGVSPPTWELGLAWKVLSQQRAARGRLPRRN